MGERRDLAAALVARADAVVRERCAMAGIDMFDDRSRIPIEPKLIMDLIGAVAFYSAEHDPPQARDGQDDIQGGR